MQNPEKPTLGRRIKNTGKKLFSQGIFYAQNAAVSTLETGVDLAVITNLDPDVHVIDTKGLQVTLQLPVTHTFTTLPLKQRAREVSDTFLDSGKIKIPVKLPKGITDLNTVSHPTPSRTTSLWGKTLPLPGPKLRHKILDIANRGYPSALLKLQASGSTKALKRLNKNGVKTSIETQEAAELNPVLESKITIFYYDQSGGYHKLKVPFSLGQEPLSLDHNGNITSIYKIYDKEFHPSLLGVKSFSKFLALHIYENTQGNATINPDIIEESLILSAYADEDTNEIIQPNIERMLAIDIIGELINQKPNEFLLGLFNAVEFTDEKGKTHPQQNKIRALIAANVIPAFETLPNDQTRSTTFIHLIQNISKITTHHKAFMGWRRDHRLIQVALDNARSLDQLNILVEEMDSSISIPPKEEKPVQPIEPRIFLTMSTMPAVLLAGAISYITESETHSAFSLDESRRVIRTSQLLRNFSKIFTEKHILYLDDFEASIIKELKKLPRLGKSKGKAAGEKVIERTVKQITASDDDYTSVDTSEHESFDNHSSEENLTPRE